MKIKKTLKIVYSNIVTPGNFLSLIQSLFFRMSFITMESSKEEKNLKKRKKKKKTRNKKKTITNITLYIHTLSNNISNHHFLQIYTAHRFPHPSPKSWCVYLGLDLRSCKLSKWFCSWLISSKEGRVFNLPTNLTLISCHKFFIHTQADLVFQNVDLNSFPNHIRYN